MGGGSSDIIPQGAGEQYAQAIAYYFSSTLLVSERYRPANSQYH